MKTISTQILLCLLPLCFTLWSCSSKKPVEGVWQQQYYIGQDGDTIQRTNSYLKFVTKERFAWMDFVPEQKLFRGAGGGTYKYKDGKYIEYLEYYIADSTLVGDSIVFDCDIKGDTWHHRGTWHTKEYGDLVINEVWKRLE